MRSKNAVPQIDLNMLPVTGKALSMDNVLLLSDNLDDCDNEAAKAGHEATDPFKMMFYGIILCVKGETDITVNLTTYHVSSGNLFVFHPGMIISGIRNSEMSRVALCFISEESFFTDHKDRYWALIHKNAYHPSIIQLDDKGVKEAIDFYKTMRRVIEDTAFQFQREVVDGFVKIIFATMASFIARQSEENVESEKSREELLFLRFLQDVQANCTRERRISWYAGRLCISPKYFAKIIYNASGKHASAWIKEYVILEAKAMLKTGAYSVQQVSDALGFPNSSFFGKYFKAAVGITPGEFISS